MKHIAGPGSTDLVAGIFNNVVVPAGEVTGPVIGGLFTQVLGSFRWASFYFGCCFMGFGALLVVLHFMKVMPWRHHKDAEAEEKAMIKRRFLREASLRNIYHTSQGRSFSAEIWTSHSKLPYHKSSRE